MASFDTGIKPVESLSRKGRLGILAGLIIPSIGPPILLYHLIVHELSALQIGLLNLGMVLSYLFSGFGITVGYHRYHTHKSFLAARWLSRLLAVAGASALQGPVLDWVPKHRLHHKCSDAAGDPHSPHGHGSGWRGILAGLWYAHTGWLFKKTDAPPAKDLREDPFLVRTSKLEWYLLIVGLRLFIVPALFGLLIVGGWTGVVLGIAWMGLVPAILLLEFTFCINSVCHAFGQQKFKSGDQSRDVWWLAIPTLGESWHNGHHAFPRSYRHGLSHWLDPSAHLIWFFEKLGWVTDVKRISAARVAEKLA